MRSRRAIERTMEVGFKRHAPSRRQNIPSPGDGLPFPTPVRIVIEQGASGTSQVLTITAPTLGNRLVLFLPIDKVSGAIATPTDNGTGSWTLVGSKHEAGTGVSGAVFSKVSSGSETAITASWANTARATMVLVEVANAGAIDQSGISTTGTTSSVNTTGVITADGATVSVPQLALAFRGNDSAASTDATTTHGWSNGFTEIAENLVNHTDNANPSVSVGSKILTALGTPSTEWSYTGDTADQEIGFLVTIKRVA
jgi:hypothetical protein